ncbi:MULTISPECIES: phosphoadenylyl-sulfate reductase [Actinomyces]|uniref:Adenosine 5'-phosphosulfate reductase n=1 Tax=Actinomyces glycerinitolerans TaxID=1892869 RepID=A0A1M4S2G2_9ACTO|nr:MULTISPECIES: phosphoadenylyl-sulfate reductase [Actinomyces]RAX23536.1 phosphoadenylyl-sulfate reductase [Actinomyces sp. Z3]SHE26368.1 phosphoadenosine phosphosulphate reductase [Actinomyces glycerinitolerans]
MSTEGIAPLAGLRAATIPVLTADSAPATAPTASPAGVNPYGRLVARGANRPRSAQAPRRSEAELRRIAADGAARLGSNASAEAVVAWAAETFPGSLAVACSMADAVLPHVVASRIPGVDTLFLETGFHFPQTEQTRDAVARTMDVTVIDVLPELTIAQQDAEYGPRLYERDPTKCCYLRKVAPLARALSGYEAWATGLRREDSPTRADAPLVAFDENHRIVKLNPLAAWSFDDLLEYATAHDVVVNPLLADGYPSIGCETCTRRVAPGEDPRSGRWAGFAKTECGIHL